MLRRGLLARIETQRRRVGLESSRRQSSVDDQMCSPPRERHGGGQCPHAIAGRKLHHLSAKSKGAGTPFARRRSIAISDTPPSLLGSGREDSLQSDAEIQRQVRLHIVMRLVAACGRKRIGVHLHQRRIRIKEVAACGAV